MSDHGTSGIQIGVDGAAAVALDSPLQLAQQLRVADVLVLTGSPGRIGVRRDGEGWAVDAGARRGRAPNTDAAYDLLRSWCNGDGWWLEAFDWVVN